MSKNKSVDYTQYVHEFIDDQGVTRYAVGEWIESAGQYQCPLDANSRKLTGCHTECARTPSGLGGYKTKRQALRRARYIFGDNQ
ncbi:MAG: hypothetical protein WC657_03845 [Candidatus Paceibacterota bacterium]|jgi:hypothetical protein